jgi:hypothetical protein
MIIFVRTLFFSAFKSSKLPDVDYLSKGLLTAPHSSSVMLKYSKGEAI